MTSKPRTIDVDVFRRARAEGAPLHLAAYVARPPVLDLDWESSYAGDEAWADFTFDGRTFRATVRDPRAIEGECIGCAELLDAHERGDENVAWLTPDEYDRMVHRYVVVAELDEDGRELGDAALWGACGFDDTFVNRLTNEHYLAEVVRELASDAAYVTDRGRLLGVDQ